MFPERCAAQHKQISRGNAPWQTRENIEEVYNKFDYLIDTHTAVAYNIAKSDDSEGKVVIDSTANPYKFSGNVAQAICKESYEDEYEAVDELNKETGFEIHHAISSIRGKKPIHKDIIEKTEMKKAVLKILD